MYTYLTDVYQNKAEYCVIFLSEHYAKSRWANLECKAAQARAFEENRPYILPIKLDKTEIPGLLPTVAYMSLGKAGMGEIAQTLVRKIESQA